ncbi:hypothetical protein ACEYYA_12640 [Paracoccus sp. p3-h83]|uniref:hypothetical protein n=1 Tax=Paracoccus sp. p3-h83 TaxID=3342805 RepID=UPI0035B7245C
MRGPDGIGLIASVVTALAAVVAVIVIPWQIAATDRIQRGQTAREIYREFLSLSVNKPEVASANWCNLTDAKAKTAYAAYVDFLLYTAEQTIDTDPEWQPVMREHLSVHLPYLCGAEDVSDVQTPVAGLLTQMRAECAKVPAC